MSTSASGLIIPASYSQLIVTYGDPGVGGDAPLASWVKANIVECHAGESGPRGRPPMPLLDRYYFQCHKLCEPDMRLALKKIADVPSLAAYVKSAASFVFRRMRHDTVEKAQAEHRHLMPLSVHSWGAALDLNTGDNASHTFHPGQTPEPWSPEWNRTWPRGVPKEIVAIFESIGFRWGGRWKGFVDPMHFELVGH